MQTYFCCVSKILLTPIAYSTSDQTEEESENIHDVAEVTFNSWVEALQKVWDRHNQEE